MWRVTKTDRERKRIEAIEFVRQMRAANKASQAEETPEYEACERHPGWKPSRMRPPGHMCPYCLRESDEKHRADATVKPPPPTSREKDYLERHTERIERQGVVVPYSETEELFLERIDELREEELEREAARGKRRKPGQFVCGRIKGGIYVEIYNTNPSGMAPRFIEVAP